MLALRDEVGSGSKPAINRGHMLSCTNRPVSLVRKRLRIQSFSFPISLNHNRAKRSFNKIEASFIELTAKFNEYEACRFPTLRVFPIVIAALHGIA